MAVYPHMSILRPHHCNILPDAGVACTLTDSSNFELLGSKVHKNGIFPAQDVMNHHAKFDAASCILAGEIRNRTNKQTNSK